jgi:4a-hydroxytetrahydrobiopterin dehydratase
VTPGETGPAAGPTARPTRQGASDAVGGLGWRYVLGALATQVRAGSPAAAARLAVRITEVAGADAGTHLRVDLRGDRLLLLLQSGQVSAVTVRDLELATEITTAVRTAGLVTEPSSGRAVQLMEIAVDAIEIPAVRPFWKAALGYTDEPGTTGPAGPLVDPLGQGPAVWFQQMDAPRTRRNRIHLDVSVPHDEAPGRIAAALAAGGRVVSDADAPSFWVLADVEGNEVCITTWQGRD